MFLVCEIKSVSDTHLSHILFVALTYKYVCLRARKENICMKRIVILLVLSFLFANFIVAAASNDGLLISEIVVRPGMGS